MTKEKTKKKELRESGKEEEEGQTIKPDSKIGEMINPNNFDNNTNSIIDLNIKKPEASFINDTTNSAIVLKNILISFLFLLLLNIFLPLLVARIFFFY